MLARKHGLHVYEMHWVDGDHTSVMATPFYKRRVSILQGLPNGGDIFLVLVSRNIYNIESKMPCEL